MGVMLRIQTLESVCKDFSRAACRRDRAVECALYLILVRSRLKGKASNTAGLHATTTAAALQASVSA